MISTLLKRSALAVLLLSPPVLAVGFGEMVLHSRVGETLRAEVPILLSDSEKISSTACFNLAPLPGSDLPVVSNAQTQLVRDGNKYRLLITGSRPFAEPVFVIGLRINCGFDLQRDYVLMPAEPLMTAEASALPQVAPKARPTGGRNRKSGEWQASDGDTLESVAEATAPDDMVRQQKTQAAAKRANPQPLAARDSVRQPRSARRADNPAAPSPGRNTNPAMAAPPDMAVAAGTKSSNPANTGDRIVLGAPPEDLPRTPRQPPLRGSKSDLDERLLRLETTLHQLNEEVDKLNKVLELTTETIAVQQKLQLAQALQSRSAGEAAMVLAGPVPTQTNTATSNWLELLFSALIGGGIAAGLAHRLSRRENPTREQILAHPATAEVTPAPAGRQPADASSIVRRPVDDAASTPPAVDLPQDENSDSPEPAAQIAVNFNETATALELAQIMLSYGRIKGAADTLARHIEQNSPDNVQPWQMLLDLYRRGNLRPEFDTLAQRIRHKFNMHIASWDDSTTPVSGLKSLEDYAHITWRLVSQWGKQECLDYLFDLIHDSRSGQRFGFPLEIVEEITLLMRVLEEAYGLKRQA